MMFDFTDLIIAALGLLGAFVTYKVIPWIRANYTKAELEKAMMWGEIAVKSAEQLAKSGKIKMEERKEYAMKFLVSKNINLDLAQISTVIESFVLDLPHLLLEQEESDEQSGDSEDNEGG